MDQKDWQILRELRQDGRATTRMIAKRTGIPISTVHTRMKQLEADGVIDGYTARVNYARIGKPFLAIVLVSIDYGALRSADKDQHQLAEELYQYSEVQRVRVVTGTTDLVVEVRVADVQAFDTFLLKTLQTTDGIAHTQSLVAIHEASQA